MILPQQEICLTEGSTCVHLVNSNHFYSWSAGRSHASRASSAACIFPQLCRRYRDDLDLAALNEVHLRQRVQTERIGQ